MEDLISHWQPRLIDLASSYHHSDAAHDLSHLDRVWKNARLLLVSQPEADALVVLAACYLHDLVNLPKDSPERANASRLAAREAVRQLSRLDFPEQLLPAVAHAIEAHSFSAKIEPQTLEAKITQDADRIEALGAIGLARMFHVSGQLGRALAHPDDPLAQYRPLDDLTYALDHIETKLRHLPGTMKTQAGRQLAEMRLGFLLQFQNQFIAEWQGNEAATS